MSESRYSVTQAAALAEVKSYVLRYWEEELGLPIGRNEMDHRYYTRRDIQIFLSIKELKKKGLSLKDIEKLVPLFYGQDTKPKGEITKKKQDKTKPEIPQESSERQDPEVKIKPEDHKNPQIPEEFWSILDKLITASKGEKTGEEERFKRLDEAIRRHQQTRREIAASKEMEGKTGRA